MAIDRFESRSCSPEHLAYFRGKRKAVTRLRCGVGYQMAGVKRDGSKRTYALNDGHLRLALHFCELCPAVSGETEEAIVVDGGFFAALLA